MSDPVCNSQNLGLGGAPGPPVTTTTTLQGPPGSHQATNLGSTTCTSLSEQSQPLSPKKLLALCQSTQHHTSANSVIGSKHRTTQAGGGGVLGDPKAVTSSHNCLPPLALTAPSDSTTTSVVTSSVGKYFTDND